LTQDRALELLKKVFGHAGFRGAQEEIVLHVAGGGDALVLMPTGGGKSLCYQLPALLREGAAIVVSPLIALMQDQVAALRQLGVRAAFLNSTLGAREAQLIEKDFANGELELLYVAPERLLMPRTLNLLEGSRLALFAIDEAHCVAQWGHDFRPEYLQLSVLHERFPGVPRIALTATADPHTRAEIMHRLALQDARLFISSFDRPNIRYTVVEKLQQRDREQHVQVEQGVEAEKGQDSIGRDRPACRAGEQAQDQIGEQDRRQDDEKPDRRGGQFADQRTAEDHDAGNRFDFFGIFCRQWPEKALTAIM
jgi:RecQ family ATP-dependent DNA helicase